MKCRVALIFLKQKSDQVESEHRSTGALGETAEVAQPAAFPFSDSPPRAIFADILLEVVRGRLIIAYTYSP